MKMTEVYVNGEEMDKQSFGNKYYDTFLIIHEIGFVYGIGGDSSFTFLHEDSKQQIDFIGFVRQLNNIIPFELTTKIV
jgi:hypothetical protein